MRILSTGDWHFNAGYDKDIENSVVQIIEYLKDACENGTLPNIAAITGDIYERSSEPGSRNMAADLIREIACYVPVLIVRGNHDAPGDLDIFSKMNSKHAIWVHSVPGFIPVDGVGIHTLPWLTKARWQSLHPEATKEEGDKTVSQLALEYLRNDIAIHNDCKKHILVSHCLVAGAKAQNHQQVGADGVSIGQYDLEEIGFFAAMLGHIHLKQWIGDSCRYFYNGSVAALEYGEEPDKYFSVFDTDSGTAEWIKLYTIHRQDIDAEWTENGILVTNKMPNRLLKGARVRANLRVNGGDNVALAKKMLTEWLENCEPLEYQINPQVIPATKIRSVEISKALTMRAKLVKHWEATSSELDEKTKNRMFEMLAQLEDECDL